MFKKRFVSIFFTPARVYLLLMDVEHKRVIRYGAIDLPPGIIVNHRVAKSQELALFLKDAWSKLKLGEKLVGIVVPEFSTYTKLVTLPPLNHKELDEAVRWQSQDFLPGAALDMVLDWNVVTRTKEGVTVLATAIHQEVLSDYVGVAASAGLMPLVVETPSISLARIADGDGKGRMIIYVAPTETILVITKGETVMASSVANSSSQQEIINTAVRMVRHYSGLAIDEVKVGGAGLAQQFFDGLKQMLGKTVTLVDYKLEGLEPGLVQEYLIPISLQLKEPAAPDDETTINLLPEMWVKVYRRKHLNLQIWSLTLVGSIFLWSCFLFVLMSYMLLSRQLVLLQEESEGPAAKNAEIAQEVNRVNTLSQQVIAIKEAEREPQSYINTIRKLAPEGINLTYYKFDLEKGSFTIRGEARDRQALAAFKTSLEGNSDVSGIHLPLSSFVTEGSAPFEITFAYGKAEAPPTPPKMKLQ